MFILFIQLLFSIIGTVLITIFGLAPIQGIDYLWIVLIFIGNMIVMLIGSLLDFVILTYVFEKAKPTMKLKHWLIAEFGWYAFVFFYRVRLHVTGLENMPKNQRFVIFSNHIEYSDPIYMKLIFRKYPISFVAKEPLFKTFFVSNLLSGIGCVSIGKNADRAAMQSILESIKIVKAGQPMGIFPEGRRTYSNVMTDFKPGAFKLATKAEADIVPICLYNMHGIYNNRGIRKHDVYVHIFPTISYESIQHLDTVTIAENVKSLLQGKLDEYLKTYPDN